MSFFKSPSIVFGLHSGYKLYQAALFTRRLCKATDIQFPTISHEEKYPADIKRVANQKDGKNTQVIISQYESKDKEVDK